ncbi:unnamed protein product [Amoebophrya sp. A120]|nr:unnamed protein product [Amoebophrya sp. A120]|eukprot:GSA120T00004540001.1
MPAFTSPASSRSLFAVSEGFGFLSSCLLCVRRTHLLRRVFVSALCFPQFLLVARGNKTGDELVESTSSDVVLEAAGGGDASSPTQAHAQQGLTHPAERPDEADPEQTAFIYGEGHTIAEKEELPLFYFYDQRFEKELVWTSTTSRRGGTSRVGGSAHASTSTHLPAGDEQDENYDLDESTSTSTHLPADDEQDENYDLYQEENPREYRHEYHFGQKPMREIIISSASSSSTTTHGTTSTYSSSASRTSSSFPGRSLKRAAEQKLRYWGPFGTGENVTTKEDADVAPRRTSTRGAKKILNIALVICGSAEKRYFNVWGTRVVDYEKIWSVAGRMRRFLMEPNVRSADPKTSTEFHFYVFLCGWPDLEVVGERTGLRSDDSENRDAATSTKTTTGGMKKSLRVVSASNEEMRYWARHFLAPPKAQEPQEKVNPAADHAAKTPDFKVTLVRFLRGGWRNYGDLVEKISPASSKSGVQITRPSSASSPVVLPPTLQALKESTTLTTFTGQFEHLDACFRGVRQFQELYRDSNYALDVHEEKDHQHQPDVDHHSKINFSTSKNKLRFTYFVRLRPDLLLYDDFPILTLFPETRVAMRAVNVVSTTPALFEDATPMMRRQFCPDERAQNLGDEYQCRTPRFFNRTYGRKEREFDETMFGLHPGADSISNAVLKTSSMTIKNSSAVVSSDEDLPVGDDPGPQLKTTDAILQNFREYLREVDVPMCAGLDDQAIIVPEILADVVFLDGRSDKAWTDFSVREMKNQGSGSSSVVASAKKISEVDAIGQQQNKSNHQDNPNELNNYVSWFKSVNNPKTEYGKRFRKAAPFKKGFLRLLEQEYEHFVKKGGTDAVANPSLRTKWKMVKQEIIMSTTSKVDVHDAAHLPAGKITTRTTRNNWKRTNIIVMAVGEGENSGQNLFIKLTFEAMIHPEELGTTAVEQPGRQLHSPNFLIARAVSSSTSSLSTAESEANVEQREQVVDNANNNKTDPFIPLLFPNPRDGRRKMLGWQEGVRQSCDYFVRDWNRTTIFGGGGDQAEQVPVKKRARLAALQAASTAFYGPKGALHAMEKCEAYIFPSQLYVRKREKVEKFFASTNTSSTSMTNPHSLLPSATQSKILPSWANFPEKMYDAMHPLGFNDNEVVMTVRVYARQVPVLIIPIAVSLLSFTNKGIVFGPTPEQEGCEEVEEDEPLRPEEQQSKNKMEDLQQLDTLVKTGRISYQLRKRIEQLAKISPEMLVEQKKNENTVENAEATTSSGSSATATQIRPSSAAVDMVAASPRSSASRYCPADTDYPEQPLHLPLTASHRASKVTPKDATCRHLYAKKLELMNELNPRPAQRRISRITGPMKWVNEAEL